jgi:hypothetical protein
MHDLTNLSLLMPSQGTTRPGMACEWATPTGRERAEAWAHGRLRPPDDDAYEWVEVWTVGSTEPRFVRGRRRTATAP